MKKAFFINGGAGRVICAIPALEYYIQNIDPTAIIIAEGWPEIFLTSKIIRNNVYQLNHKGLFDLIKDRELITPEPYKLNAYFNQKANLVQAFDIIINDLEDIPETKQFNIELGKADKIMAKNLINQCKNHFQRDKVILIQPFGKGAEVTGDYIVDTSGRSFEVDDIVKIIKELNKEYAIIMMSPFKLPIKETIGIMTPNDVNLLQWAAIINEVDYFLGCDSVGQHFANSLDKPSTVVIGATYPENISYPNNKKFNIVDNGKDNRQYSPIRITGDWLIDRNNENLMSLSDKTIKEITNNIYNVLGNNNFIPENYQPIQQPQQSDCCSK